jgi:drug/metabolite transporter (DMT)-like permease
MAVMGIRSEKLPRDAKTWRKLLLQSFLNSIGAWTVLAWGRQYVDSGLASVLNSTSPIFVFLITGTITRHEALGGRKLLGVTFGLFGVVLIVGVDALDGLGAQTAGQIACLIGALLYGCAAIYGKQFGHISPVATAAGALIWATIVLIPAALIIDKPWTLAPNANAIAATAVLSIFCTGVALLIYFRLIRTLGSIGVVSQSYLRAGVGVLLGMIFLGETLSPAIAVGLFAAIAGVILINLPVRQKPQR